MRLSERLIRSVYKRMYGALKLFTSLHIINKYLLWGLSSKNQAVRSYAQSKLVLNQQKLKLQELNLSEGQRINLWWAYKPLPGNLGDSLNPHLIEFLTDVPPLWCKAGKGMMAIGSTIERAKAGCDVWGSGLISMSTTFKTDCNFKAVRGPYTHQRLIEAGAKCPKVFGDPAILLPLFIQPSRQFKRTKIGVIPHYQHAHYDFAGCDQVISVDRATLEDFKEFVDEINQCAFVFSSSLHGLILCRAYEVPCARIIFERDQLIGDDVKFADYRLGVGLTKPNFPEIVYQSDTRWDLNLVQTVESDEPFKDFEIKQLIESFPYPQRLKNSEFLSNQLVKV